MFRFQQTSLLGKTRLRGGLALLAVAGLLASSAPARDALAEPAAPSAKPAGKTKGFVFSYLWYAMAYGADDCPDGLAISLAGGVDRPAPYNAGRPLGPQGRGGIRPDGIDDQCTNPAAFEDPAMRTGHGHSAYGMNLDGATDASAAAPNTCAHEKYTGMNGERGVDNQLYRILGCINAYRPESTFQGNVIRDFVVSARQDGQVTTVLEITGIDDEKNDPDVEVGIYSSPNPTLYDADRQGVPYSSLTTTSNPRWRNVTHGKIVNGVLTTDPIDMRLDHYPGEGLKNHADMFIRSARIRLEIQPDGSAKGMLAGYSDVETVYHAEFGMAYSVLPKSFGWTCPAAYAALHKLADGYPDPKTGKCTAISTAYRIEAVPAFLIHPQKLQTAAPKLSEAAQPAKPVQVAEGPATGWLRKLGW
jgi:hypothetical protein